MNLTEPSNNSYYICTNISWYCKCITHNTTHNYLLKELKRESGIDMNASLDKTL